MELFTPTRLSESIKTIDTYIPVNVLTWIIMSFFFHVWKHWSKMLLSYDTTRTFNLCVCMIYYLLLLYFCVPLKSILPQLRYSKQSFLHSVTCCYGSLQIWTAKWMVCAYLVLRWPASAQKVCGNSSNADRFFISAETLLTSTLYGQTLMCSSLI